MPKRKLNEITIKHLPIPKTGQVDYFDSTLPCFGVRVSLGGTKTYFLHYRNRRSTLGRVGITTLKEARDEARRRLNIKYFPQVIHTQTAINEYLEAVKGEKRPATYNVYRLYLARLPSGKLADLGASQLYAALPKTKSAANLCFATFRAFFSWCVERGHLSTHPLLKRRQPNKVKSRDRLLTDDEIRLIWKESYNHHDFGTLVRVLLLSGQRLNQIISLEVSWLHPTTIVFPAYSMKSNIEHVIPLTDAVYQQLNDIRDTAILPPAASYNHRGVRAQSSPTHNHRRPSASSKYPTLAPNEPSGSRPTSEDCSSDSSYSTYSSPAAPSPYSATSSARHNYTRDTNNKLQDRASLTDNALSPAKKPPSPSADTSHNVIPAYLQSTTLFPKLHISHQMKVFREALNARTSLTGGSREIELVQDLPPIIPHFTLHDFRRYLSSTMSRLKVPIDITEAILAHRSGSRSQIQRTYDRDARIPQMREALELYEKHLLGIIGE